MPLHHFYSHLFFANESQVWFILKFCELEKLEIIKKAEVKMIVFHGLQPFIIVYFHSNKCSAHKKVG